MGMVVFFLDLWFRVFRLVDITLTVCASGVGRLRFNVFGATTLSGRFFVHGQDARGTSDYRQALRTPCEWH